MLNTCSECRHPLYPFFRCVFHRLGWAQLQVGGGEGKTTPVEIQG